ncbi:hypothetical protein OGAPHI_006584 [Ogataea philodendri]|uniref:Uncharacterized protein n=1 Tax=Ogataea philodendri TaxID=1378263 RepID=A0A9P8NXD9_9ASCO|nr:uncharacterized protein OGAPHI_006584 [Ogataea philodendri]KAH3661177.1 hypothetical protein OGAPHI_006584 [Ogataea philodendri]
MQRNLVLSASFLGSQTRASSATLGSKCVTQNTAFHCRSTVPPSWPTCRALQQAAVVAGPVSANWPVSPSSSLSRASESANSRDATGARAACCSVPSSSSPAPECTPAGCCTPSPPESGPLCNSYTLRSCNAILDPSKQQPPPDVSQSPGTPADVYLTNQSWYPVPTANTRSPGSKTAIAGSSASIAPSAERSRHEQISDH